MATEGGGISQSAFQEYRLSNKKLNKNRSKLPGEKGFQFGRKDGDDCFENGGARSHRETADVVRREEAVLNASTSAVLSPVERRPFYRHLYFQVLIAIALGAVIGHFWPSTTGPNGEAIAG
ncbi:MAG: hypothetical protein JHC99_08705, partial [Brevundimonas sp.]|nr:hypothetical protein [Brevundimonas sp.]